MLTEEILESIDLIEETQLVSEMAVMESLLNYYDKAIMIMENTDEDRLEEFQVFNESVTMEATGDNKIKNLAMSIWSSIKKFFSMIGRWITKFVNFIKNLFKKKTKSVDQILDECGVKPTGTNISTSNKQSVSSNQSQRTSSSSNTSGRVPIPADPKSEIKPLDGETLSKEFVIKFNQDGTFNIQLEVVNAHMNMSKWSREDGRKLNENVRSQGTANSGSVNNVFGLIITPELYTRFETLINTVCDFIGNDNNKSIDDVTDALEGYKNFNTTFKKYDNISIDQFVDLQKKINGLFYKMNKLPFDTSVDQNRVLVEALRHIIGYLSNVQMGMNNISSAFQKIHVIDKSYVESIDDLTTLDKFVHEMIKSGLPSKYIQQNIWLVASKNIKGNSDKDKPIWGQSRVVFLPTANENSVYKVALSGMGISGNTNEEHVTKLCGNDTGNYFAEVKSIQPNKTVVETARVDTSEKPHDSIINDVIRNISTLLNNKNASLEIGDLHSGNFGRKANGIWVVVDYGDIKRA